MSLFQKKEQFELWKEQIKYTLQSPNIKFEEI